MPGTARADVPVSIIDSFLLPDTRYACLYWVHHMKESGGILNDDHEVHKFLKFHLLHWLEALSLLGKVSESLSMIESLKGIISPGVESGISIFLHDSTRFILHFRSIIEKHPLQIYSSALIFSPTQSLVKSTFANVIPGWISRLPESDSHWGDCEQALEGHTGYINDCAFSPDGTTIASASADRTVRIWNATVGTEKHRLDCHGHMAVSVAFASDGQTLASAADDRTVRLWNVATGREKHELIHDSSIEVCAFSPDGTKLASVCVNGSVCIWHAVAGHKDVTLQGCHDPEHSPTCCAFLPDNTSVMVVSSDDDCPVIQFWDIDVENLASCSSDPKRTIRCTEAAFYEEDKRTPWSDRYVTALSPDCSMLATSLGSNAIHLWDTKIGNHQRRLTGLYGMIRSICFLPDDKTLAASRNEHKIELWNYQTGQTTHFINTLHNVQAIAFSPGKRAIGAVGNTLRLFHALEAQQANIHGEDFALSSNALEVNRGTGLETRKGNLDLQANDRINKITYSPDGETLATMSSTYSILQIWHAATGRLLNKISMPNDWDFSPAASINNANAWNNIVTFSPTSKSIACITGESALGVWSVATGEQTQSLRFHSEEVSAISFSPNSTRIASGTLNGSIQLWDVATGNELQKIACWPQYDRSIAFAGNDHIVLITQSQSVWSWDTTNREIKPLISDMEPFVHAIAWLPNTDMIVLSTTTNPQVSINEIGLWDMITGYHLRTICTMNGRPLIRNLRFAADNQALMTGYGLLSYCSDSALQDQEKLDTSLIVCQDWFVHGGNRILWIPPDYRSDIMDFHVDTFAWAIPSGRLVFIQFNLE